ncbi:methyltransferase [Flavobacterium sp. LM5]|uniref:class I SAM-dependent methyltransferase n=1 Tax=Flavobacterium sp. LM5 TaxID=1938610 RepID=UPI0009944840|nr:class I SAM-dependent methyltransferase [Flavobacterium sp. LM5]OOV29317.1 methyltransferase [Flavobacterium sp. LM5]
MKSLEAIVETNKKQAEFYNTKRKNVPTKIWSYFREKTLKNIRKEIGILNQCYDLHKVWFGDLQNKKVLDLGCYAGNNLSMYLAENSKEYIGLDLSEVAIAKLNQRLESTPTAKAMAADFLSDVDFQDKDFDLIYAYGVLHHFENHQVLIQKLNDKLARGGQIISYDPLETSWPIKIMRRMYRPFQTDAAWEWPFTKKTYYAFADAFEIKERHGIFGRAKWYFLYQFLPLSDTKRTEIGIAMHQKDWVESEKKDSYLFDCMHVTMLMQKK